MRDLSRADGHDLGNRHLTANHHRGRPLATLLRYLRRGRRGERSDGCERENDDFSGTTGGRSAQSSWALADDCRRHRTVGLITRAADH